jgi:glycosyltransferase involved in cell wall biosynthesis
MQRPAPNTLLLVTPGFAAHEQDLNCIPTLQLLVRAFLQKNIDIQIVAPEYPFSDQPYHWHGVPVFPGNGQNRRWLRPRSIARTLGHCERIVARSKGSVVLHSFWIGWASRVGEWVAKRHGLAHFTTMMGQDVLPANHWHLRHLSPARAARLVAVSDFQNQIFEQNVGFRAAHVVPWGVAASEIPSTLPTERPLDILGVGSLILLKNWEKWLQTVAVAAQKRPGLRAELIGNGPDQTRLESLARQIGCAENVRFVGSLPRPEVLARMQAAKVLLHTSSYESYGLVLAEAAANGCQIVSTPVGIAPEMGHCAEQPEALAEQLLRAIAAPPRSAPFVPFSIEQAAEAYWRLYQKWVVSDFE